MARTNGPIRVWHRADTIPTDAEGGYAGGDSTAAAIALLQGSVDALNARVAGINVGVGSIAARPNSDGTVTISWTGEASGGGGGGGTPGTVSWGSITGKPTTFPAAPHSHPVSQIEAGGTRASTAFLRGDGTWARPSDVESSGGILRLYASGPEIHTNDSHGNTAITGFGASGASTAWTDTDMCDASGRLIVKHSTKGPKIVNISISPDETLTANGISVGPSGGVGTTVLQFNQGTTLLDMRVPADRAKVVGPFSNLWMGWLHERSPL